ncbi:hypothetical protein V474_18425 [Novosphingobium barchaimii LL02]|uniref:Uncharacterized protein n=1 Tax=Novosphingobium barchaimii LL02 TaxID=1114963 RepID=A0A0J8ALK0_9SPHN|nr:hypothetical protein [Novosphingobium barchaimii]KMS55475.1 hypothetical protein V474_18425 [Novosphingobium barchaimii LL02]
MKAPVLLKLVSDKAFANERVRIDGTEFQRCTFENCILTYTGAGRFILHDCDGADGAVEFEGPAASTLHALQSAYADGMDGWVEGIFASIRNLKPDIRAGS